MQKQLVLAFFFALMLSFGFINTVDAASVDQSCARIEIVFARGSGDGPAQDEETGRYIDQIKNRIKGSQLSVHEYAVGTESYGGNQYPHIDAGNVWNGNALGALVTAGYGNDYGKSVSSGVNELNTYLIQRYNKCKSNGSYYILGGYSQGAQVIGQALHNTPKEIRDRIIYVGLFGDPKLYYPEGDYFFTPPACRGVRSVYRRGPIVDCLQYQGSLGPRKPYLADDMKSKTGLWCYKDDFVCGTSSFPWVLSGHSTYKNPGLAIDQAAREASEKLLAALDNEPHPPTPSPSPEPTPTPQLDHSKLIDTTYKFGSGLTGQDVVFVIDKSSNMASLLPTLRQTIKDATLKITASGGHFAVASYCTYPGPGIASPSTQLIPLDFSYDDYGIDTYLQLLTAPCPYNNSYPNDILSVLRVIMYGLNWHKGAAKSITLFTNNTNPILDPTEYDFTSTQLAQLALAIDPVNVYSVVPQTGTSFYQSLANSTSGAVLPYTDNIGQAADAAMNMINDRPVAFLGNTGYIADPGQEITFDASESYVIDSTITTYDWDFDGDGTFDASTTTPIIHHTYTDIFDGMMQVRVTAANGLIANASATIKIGTYIAPVLPQTPANLQATIVTTDDNKSTVRLTWQPTDDLATGYALSMNGVMLGTLMPDRTSIDITDVDRTIDADFTITPFTDDQTIGQSAYATLDKIPLPEPEKDTSTNTTTPATSARVTAATIDQDKATAYTIDTETFDVPQNAQHPLTTSVLGQSMANSKTSPSNTFWWWLPIPLIVTGGILWWALRHKSTD